MTRPLREHLFGVHSGWEANGADMAKVHKKWQDIIDENKERKLSGLQKTTTAEALGPIASLIEFMQESPARKNWD
ncbi:hypothetical protein D3C84_944740 [compost metagenome]